MIPLRTGALLVAQAFCITIGLVSANQAAAHWSFDGAASVSYDNNLGNARAENSVGDRALSASIAATQSEYREDGASISWGGRLAGERFAEYGGLDNLALAANVAYRRKMDLGAFAPWWRVSWSSSALSYRDHARNGWLHQAELAAGRRLDERYNLGLSFRVEKRTAAGSPDQAPGLSADAFSQLSKSLGVNAEYAPDRDVVLSLGGELRHGDVVSTSPRYRQVFLYSKAIAADPALGSDVYAYRLTGNTLSVKLGMALFLSPDSCVHIGVQRILTHGEGSNDYAKNKVAVSWLGNF